MYGIHVENVSMLKMPGGPCGSPGIHVENEEDLAGGETDENDPF